MISGVSQVKVALGDGFFKLLALSRLSDFLQKTAVLEPFADLVLRPEGKSGVTGAVVVAGHEVNEFVLPSGYELCGRRVLMMSDVRGS